MAADHPLAKDDAVDLSDLKKEVFVGAPDEDVPGHNRWVSQLCKRAGFRARFVQDAESLTHGLLLIATEGAVSLQPDYTKRSTVPGLVFRPLRDTSAKWELIGGMATGQGVGGGEDVGRGVSNEQVTGKNFLLRRRR